MELNTYSIVARCPRTGQLGVAVSSAVPAVGSMCPYTAAGVGAVSTQSWVNPALAMEVLAALRRGLGAEAALRDAIAADPGRELRQIGVVDAAGQAASHTGALCTDWHGQIVGESFAVQGNMLAGAQVLDAMASAFMAAASEPLDERLMRALEAGQRAGGDKRGKQSAALRIAGREAWPDVDLRVDEHASPVRELRRVLGVARLQLYPFVAGMAKEAGSDGALPESVTQMLLMPPPLRPGGGGALPD
jgi:uncharacterized Ntn-hydrolase superfamily protein